MKKLKTQINSDIVNITVDKAEIKTSKKGWEYAEVTVGENVVIVDARFVRANKNGTFNVGIVNNQKYRVVSDEPIATIGKDLIEFYFAMKTETKNKKKK